MTLKLAENVPIHTLTVAIIPNRQNWPKNRLQRTRRQKADLYLRPKQGQSS